MLLRLPDLGICFRHISREFKGVDKFYNLGGGRFSGGESERGTPFY